MVRLRKPAGSPAVLATVGMINNIGMQSGDGSKENMTPWLCKKEMQYILNLPHDYYEKVTK